MPQSVSCRNVANMSKLRVALREGTPGANIVSRQTGLVLPDDDVSVSVLETNAVGSSPARDKI